jgi:hypothetical protein
MNLLDLVWHLLNFLAPAAALGSFTVLLTKLVWHRALQGMSWRRLWLAAVGSALAAGAVGLILTGRDGKVATYGAMVLACALGTYWAAFMRRPA